VLAIAAQIPSAEIGRGYFLETHPEHLFKDCGYYCELVSQPEQMPRILGIAMRTALGKRGVAVVVIPVDVALQECTGPALSLGIQDSAIMVSIMTPIVFIEAASACDAMVIIDTREVLWF